MITQCYKKKTDDGIDSNNLKRKATLAQHAKPVIASESVLPSSTIKKRKKKVTKRRKKTNTFKGKRASNNNSSANNFKSTSLFHGETTPHATEQCEATIVVETFYRNGELAKGISNCKEKKYPPGDLKYVNDNNNDKKLSSVLLCETTAAYLYAFRRADMRPHFVLSPMAATKHLVTVVEGENMQFSPDPLSVFQFAN